MKLFRNKYKQLSLYVGLAIACIASFIFVFHNASFYDRPIAKVIEVEIIDEMQVTDFRNNKDKLFTQRLVAEMSNGQEKGQRIELINEYSDSGAYDQKYKVGHELFVLIDKNISNNQVLTGTIKDVKRDKYLVIITWVFIFTLLIVGKKQGLYSVVSLIINAALLSYALDVYVQNSTISLVLICGVTAILFTVISLFLVNGINEKTYAAIIATMLGTFASLLITYLVIWIAAENGLRYEEMQFISRPYQMVFMAGLFVGSLGAVMDIAITMSASIFEIYEKNPDVTSKALQKSGMEIGKDVMGTMTSILFFVYVSGSLPMLILYLKNAAPLGFTLSMNLSLELARALAGGIGIVLTIPIGLYTAIFFVNRKRARL
ncbi:YibE/F family protein [Sporosarcina ureilytica]|uniref:YibE/F-like family protein n=1 Tax=Sporosarcina ureilytica TaxID=298596 RepID=A0A1D8JFU5_9BACL|nr:YibE/F family protein [Sporosarcina ureilytica]AOV07563.1 yibE/F-like family protein [Sporosarcina ureilytica]